MREKDYFKWLKKNKAPAYQWYPKDILTDKRVMGMTLAQEAIYRRLLDFAWLEDGLDDDMQLLASYSKLGEQLDVFMKHWEIIQKCFTKVNSKWKNPRQEKERKKQKVFRKKQKKAAQVRWNKEVKPVLENDANASVWHGSGNALHLQSSSSFASAKINQLNPLNLKEEQVIELRRIISQKMGHAMVSEANESAWKEFVLRQEKFIKKNKIKQVFEYMLASAQNIGKPVAA